MKIQILSDLHLEGGIPSWLQNFKAIGDVLVLAGDIVNARNISSLNLFNSHDLGVPVIYVLGNHEYYKGNYPETKDAIREYISEERLGITLLDNEIADLIFNGEKVRFIGATLWSTVSPLDEGDVSKYIADFRGMIGDRSVLQHNMNGEFSRGLIKYYLENANREDVDKIVVVTHFPPSWQAQEERFKSSGMGSYFFNNMDDMILDLEPNLWIYGHSHGNLRFKIGKTPVECNQMGYLGAREPCLLTFNPHYCVEI